MIKRQILPFALESAQSFPAVIIVGARQVGKSTVLAQLKELGAIQHIFTLDNLSVLDAVSNDPYGFLSRHPDNIGLDEIQRYPKLMLAVKQSIDEKKKPGEFILTGSANLLSYPHFHESLAGRADIIIMEGLSSSELFSGENEADSLIKEIFAVFSVPDLMSHFSSRLSNAYDETTLQKMITEAIFYGAYPQVRLTLSERFRERWFNTYEMAYIERDVRDLAKTIDTVGYGKVFRTVGMQTGGLLNYQSMANDCDLDQRTVKKFIEFLQITFQATLLLPWSTNLIKRVIKTPKIYMNDVGHASFMQGILEMDEPLKANNYGYLFETWIFSELRKHIALETGCRIYFFRDHAGNEVDFIVTKGKKTIAIECKAKTTISKRDIRGIENFIAMHPEALGVIFYTGRQIIPLAQNILALPVELFFT